MRTVGQMGKFNAPLTVQEAWRRSLALDRAWPEFEKRPRSVQRLSHQQMNARDDARMLDRARQMAQLAK